MGSSVDTSGSRLPDDLAKLDRQFSQAKPGDDVFHGREGYALFEASFRPSFGGGSSERRVLHFDSVDDNATVYLNGKKLFHHEGWSDPFDVPLKDAIEGIDNVLDVIVENTSGPGGIGPVQFETLDQNETPDEAAINYSDASWRKVHLPHDFVIDGTFSEKDDPGRGALARNLGWYRKHFKLPASAKGKSVWLDFEGAFSDSHVWLNGHFLGAHRSGYTGFQLKLGSYAKFGADNVIAVRCDPSKTEGWWYEGGGLYRHVWLTTANDLHVNPLGGLYVTTTVSDEGGHQEADISVAVTVDNESKTNRSAQIEAQIISPGDHRVLAKASEAKRFTTGSNRFGFHFKQAKPKLWSVESPQLYELRVRLREGAKALDEASTSFGIRTIRFDPSQGFLLNGKQVKLKGTCNHQDFAGVGIGLPDRAFLWRIKKLKAMGSNAYRCSHNEVAPELLDACDRLGMLVMDENRELGDTWSGKANKDTTTNDLSDLRQEVLRDRNHPSVIMWSIGNEEWAIQSDPAGTRIGKAMVDAVKALDNTRPVTAALNGGHGSYFSQTLDLEGFNYDPKGYPGYHQSHPDHPMFGSETASTVTDRGEYEDNKAQGHLRAYDNRGVDWGDSAEDAWEPIAEEPYNAGGFVWTGFDYKGEPTPYSWPCVNSHFGVMDICGFAKDNYYYYQAWWGDKPIIHIEPYWNWPGKEGHPINVWVFTNGGQAELFLNGKSLGRKTVPRYRHVEWDVPYVPGVLTAKAYLNGEVIATDEVHTAGEPASLRATTTSSDLIGDAEDCTMIEVSVVDAKGQLVPRASNLISFSVKGPAWIAGVGNGDPSCHEPDRAASRHAFNGRCLGVVQSTGGNGRVLIRVSSPGLKDASVSLPVTASDMR